MTKGELTQKVQAAIDRRGEEIIALGETIRRQPELGFKEFKTAKLVAQTFERVEQEVGVQIENRCQRDQRRFHSLSYRPRSSATRSLTNRFTSVAGGGLVRGNRTVPVEVS